MHPQLLLFFRSRDGESTEILKGVLHHQRTHQPWSISLHGNERVESDSSWLLDRKWDGVIGYNASPLFVDTCSKLLLPFIDLSDCPSEYGVSKIRPDNLTVGHFGAEYFIERRFRNFGFCGYSNLSRSNERREGFVEALELAGKHCTAFEVKHPDTVTPVWESKQIGLLAGWLRSLPEETAIMACDDFCAQRVICAARAAGLMVPEKIAVLGANNDVMQCELGEPSISSVAINAYEAGRRAGEIMDRMLSGDGRMPVDVRIEPQGVVTRKSTDILAMRDKNVAIALNYIREYACQGITVDQVLERAFMSRSQLEHKFRRFVGHSPQKEIRRAQVAKISELLAATDMPLKEIAAEAGFVHVEYMCVLFKRVTGETPGAFRARFRQRRQDFVVS
jgi:LacI family transcriptional regulator